MHFRPWVLYLEIVGLWLFLINLLAIQADDSFNALSLDFFFLLFIVFNEVFNDFRMVVKDVLPLVSVFTFSFPEVVVIISS